MAALSTTAPTVHIFKKFFLAQTQNPLRSNSLSIPSTKRRLIGVKSSGELSAETASTDVESENAIGKTSKGPPSLISAVNVQRALRGIAITDVDHYGRLGLRRGCSYDQVKIAYKNMVGELMDQNLEDEELNSQMELLKESYAILSSVQERRMYDWSLTRSEMPDRYTWPFQADITQTPTQEPPPPKPEDVGPTRLVGYFMLAWLMLAFTLSIALNR